MIKTKNKNSKNQLKMKKRNNNRRGGKKKWMIRRKHYKIRSKRI
jgi:hypothetical protein